MYRIAYETLTDPFQRCVYHRASNTAEWYGLVPVFCWGEGGVGWLMRAKEAVGEWGVDAAAANQTLRLGQLDAVRCQLRFCA